MLNELICHYFNFAPYQVTMRESNLKIAYEAEKNMLNVQLSLENICRQLQSLVAPLRLETRGYENIEDDLYKCCRK